jgi:hypothetical protein
MVFAPPFQVVVIATLGCLPHPAALFLAFDVGYRYLTKDQANVKEMLEKSKKR